MTDEFNLDLEPKPERKEGPVLKRTPARKRVARPTRAAHAAPDAPPGKAGRFLGWVVSPRFYYGASFLITACAIYAMYNPGWGAVARSWPPEALGFGGVFTWDLPTARLIALAALALALLVATCLRRGGGRGLVVLVLAAATLVAFHEQAQAAALAGLAITGGALLVPRGTKRNVLLVAGLALLAAHLFMPWAPGRFTRGIDLAPSYQATAFDTIDALAAPKPGVIEDKGWPGLILERLEPAVALLLAGIGLLALLGAGGRWTRWSAGVLLLLLCFGTLAHLYLDGAEGSDEPFHAGASTAALAWFGLAAAYVLGLAAAVADMATGRAGRA